MPQFGGLSERSDQVFVHRVVQQQGDPMLLGRGRPRVGRAFGSFSPAPVPLQVRGKEELAFLWPCDAG